MVFAYIMLLGEPAYIPSKAMNSVAAEAASPSTARKALYKLLQACAPGSAFAEADLGNRVSEIHSLENDVGFFATTRINCTPDLCGVEESAIITHSAKPDVCASIGSRRGHYGRKRGWDDYFGGG